MTNCLPALVRRKQGRFEDAEKVVRTTLAIRKGLLGDEHEDVATALNNLAGLLKAQVSFVFSR